MAVIGLDVGTTGCKCGVFDEDGRLLRLSHAEYPENKPANRALDGNVIWENVKDVLLTAGKGFKIEGICISSFGESFVPLDKKDNPLSGIMLYTDPCGEEYATRLEEKFGELFKRTGAAPHSMFSLPKMMWLKDKRSDIYNAADKLLLMQDFIGYKLTGERRIDYSLASRTLAFDVKNKRWDEELLEFAGIDIKKLSKPEMSGTVFGRIKKGVMEEPCFEACVVITGGHDQVCSALGAGVLAPGSSVDGTGTVECITPVFSGFNGDPEMGKCGYTVVPYAIDGLYATYMLNYCGGRLLKWFRDNLKEGSGGAFYDEYDAKMPKTPTDLLIVPHFAGAGTPYMDNAAKGCILNLTLETTSQQIYRALMEGASYEMRLNLERAKAFGIAPKELTATGGGAKSKEWLRIKADIYNLPVYPLLTEEAGITGAAMLAFAALKKTESLQSAAKLLVKRLDPVIPNLKNVEFYNEQYEKYKKIYKMTEELR